MTAEVPGMTEKDIEVEIKDGRLTLKGHTLRSPRKRKRRHYRMREFSRRSFERSFTIGEGVDQDNIAAKLDGGVLKLVLPKKEEGKPKTVKVAIRLLISCKIEPAFLLERGFFLLFSVI